jgi:regulator of replication initiation timing
MSDDPKTAAELKAEIAALKKDLDGSVSKAEADKLRAEIATLQAELAKVKKPAPATEKADDQADTEAVQSRPRLFWWK